MQKRVLIFLFCFFLFLSLIPEAFSQNIAFGTVDPGPYGAGSDITVPISVSGSFMKGCKFELYLSDPSGLFSPVATPIGSFESHFTTYVNGVIPAGTIAGGGYRLQVRAIDSRTDITIPYQYTITIGEQVGPKITVAPTESSRILVPETIWGFCNVNYNDPEKALLINNQSTAESKVTGALYNDYSQNPIPILEFEFGSNPLYNLKLNVAYYTIRFKAIKDNIVSTRSYVILNSTNNLSLQASGAQTVCIPSVYEANSQHPDSIKYSVNMSPPSADNKGSILTNYPGLIYKIDWGDENTDYIGQQELIDSGGVIKHRYTKSSCGQPVIPLQNPVYNSYQANIFLEAPFCVGASTPITTYPKVFLAPVANFDVAGGVGCTGEIITFSNLTTPGESEDESGQSCTNVTDYSWYVKRSTEDDNSWVPFSIDQDSKYKFTSNGTYNIKLLASNKSCPPSEKIQDICIENVPVLDFDFVQSADCAPANLTVTNKTSEAGMCKIEYDWSVIDVTTGNVAATGVTFTNSNKATNPLIAVTVPGDYLLRLSTLNACGQLTLEKPFTVAGPITVVLPDESLKYCKEFPYIVDLAADLNIKPIYTGFGKNKTYKWTVTGGNGVTFLEGSDTKEFPRIEFTEPGVYSINVSYGNECVANVSDNQFITFYGPITVNPGPNAIKCDNEPGKSNTTYQFDGNTPVAGDIGTWSYVSGPAGSFIADINNPKAIVSGLVPGEYKFRWSIKNPGGCDEGKDMILTVYAKPEGGKITGDDTICIGNNGTLRIEEYKGKISDWEISTDNVTWTSTGTSTSEYSYINLQRKTFFRVKIASDGIACATQAYSAVFSVDVDPVSVGGTTTGATTYCVKSTSGQIVLSGNVGEITNWEKSTDGGTSWTRINSTSDKITYNELTVTTEFRAEIQSGECSITKSSITKIEILPAPTPAFAGNNAVLCANTTEYQLQGNQPVIGTGLWVQTLGPPATIEDPLNRNSKVSGLQNGQRYKFSWTISNGICASAPSEVTIDVLSVITNSIKADKTISCKSEPVVLRTNTLSGGDIIPAVPAVYTYQWESSENGLDWTLIAGQTNETVTVYPEMTTSYRRKVKSNGSCETVSLPVEIFINASTPQSVAGLPQILCNATSAQLAGNNPGAGFLGSWSDETSGSTVTFFPNVNDPNAEARDLEPGKSYTFRWTVKGISPCADQFSTVKVTVRKIVNTAVVGPDQFVCVDQTLVNNHTVLTGNAADPTNGETGVWSKIAGPSSFIIQDPSKHNSAVSGLTAGEYTFEWKIKSDATSANPACNESKVLLKVKVVAYPTKGIITGGNISICKGSNPGELTLASYSADDLLQWQSSTDGTTFTDVSAQNTDKFSPGNLASSIWYRVKISQPVGCSYVIYTDAVKIQVDEPTVGGASISSVGTVCTGPNSGSITLTGHLGTILNWEKSVDGGLSWEVINSTANPYVFSGLNQSTQFRAVVKNGSCNIEYSSAVPVTVLPNVTVANAGPDQFLCNEAEFSLQGNIADKGTGTWVKVSGPAAAIADPADPNSKVTGIVTGTYVFSWNITNNICAPSIDNVTINNYPALSNQVTGNTTICSGQIAQITGLTPSGGNGSYAYEWEISMDNLAWNIVQGQVLENFSAVFTATTYVRRKVTSGPCTLYSNVILVTVQPALNNNIITGDQELCIGQPSVLITGTIPTGGDTNYSYKWQKSTDGLNWQDISGETSLDYQPPVLTETTSYRRIVTTALCSGDQQLVSNSIEVVIHPLSKAEFVAAKVKSCTPFNLKDVITLNPYDDRNATFEWFADGVSIGTGKDFPDYSINNDGQEVIIRLATTSKFGCSADFKEITFATVKDVIASFTKDQVKGCGPIGVNFVNTSAPISGGTYFWDFGDGQTSTAEQPGNIIFQPHPLNRDTTYVIKLKASTGCKDTEFIDSVHVRPMPKVIFSPDKTTGCSPFTVNFTNHSRGGPNTYTFDFGDGQTFQQTDNSPVSHTYLTSKTDTLIVRLTAVNECGFDTLSYKIVVYPNVVTPELVVDGNKKFGCAPFTVKFDNNSLGANSFYWDFKDGNTLSTQSAPESVSHTFTLPGTYEVSLFATNGCSSGTTTETIVVFPLPDARFTSEKNQYCLGDTVDFKSIPGASSSFVWDFGDGTTGNAENPKHVYLREGRYTIRLTVLQSRPDGSVCSSTFAQEIEILSLPVALFTSNSTTVNCAPFKLIVSTTPANASSVQWNFGDPESADNLSSGYTAEHIYSKPGTYKIKEIAYNLSGCIDTLVKTIKILATPKAAFTASENLICGTSGTVNFVNTSTFEGTEAITYRWLVNNVQVSASKDLVHSFNVPSGAVMPYQYEVALIVRSVLGCPDTTRRTIRFNPLPKAAFDVKVSIGCAPFNLELTNKSQYSDQYSWYLDGMLVSNAQIPKNINLVGSNRTYILKLVVANEYGCAQSSFEKTVSTYPKPSALFSLTDSVSCNGILDIKINNESTGANRYSWDFGDGSPVVNALSPSHIYGKPGVYNLRLVAYGDLCNDTISKAVRIAAVPQASFTSDIQKGCTQADITFQNLSNNASTYLWDFGDGTFSTEKNPTHRFNYDKSPFNIKLTVTGEFGCTDVTILTRYIEITEPPKAAFVVLPDEIIKIPDFTFTFNNTSTGNPIKFQWSFGDGKTSAEENPVYTYRDAGAHEVTLIVTNTEGCMDTLTKTVTIEGVPGYLFVPSGFEPASMKSDLKTFIPKGSGIATYSMKIFNKWGQLIWETDKLDEKGSPLEGWDGNMAGQPAPQGVYMWNITARFIDGSEWKGMKYETGARRTVGPIHLIR